MGPDGDASIRWRAAVSLCTSRATSRPTPRAPTASGGGVGISRHPSGEALKFLAAPLGPGVMRPKVDFFEESLEEEAQPADLACGTTPALHQLRGAYHILRISARSSFSAVHAACRNFFFRMLACSRKR